MDIRHHWPEEPDFKEKPSYYKIEYSWRFSCAGLMFVIICCFVLFMFLFHDILPGNSLACAFLCFTFTGFIVYGLYRFRRWFVNRYRKPVRDPYRYNLE